MTTDERAALDLASLHRWTGRLQQFAEACAASTVDVREREAFPLEWDNAMDLLEDVETLADQNVLGTATMGDLRNVARELVDLMPLMEKLRLRVPDRGTLSRAAGRPIPSGTT
jgi:hypothetical protein